MHIAIAGPSSPGPSRSWSPASLPTGIRVRLAALRISGVCWPLLFATACRGITEPQLQWRYVRFIESLVAPSGMVRSRPNDDFTTAWKNALATMVFLHEGNLQAARGALDVFRDFQQAQGTAFRGVPQGWDAGAAVPVAQGNQPDADYYWVGDGGGLLRAVQYYGLVTADHQRYQPLENALEQWLAGRADSCATIVAEGNANMYAALSAYAEDSAIAPRLVKLRECFYNDVQFANVGDHTVRAALVFGDPSGFSHLGGLRRTETWCVDGRTTVHAFAAFSGEGYVNLDISTELLLTWNLWKQQSGTDLSFLEREISRLELGGASDPEARGLPYLVTPHQFTGACSTPILDTTAFMLFALWEWNPFSLDKGPSVR
jgi:hypothetical protein